MVNTRRRSYKLRRASAYYRLAAKFDKAGQHSQAEHYRRFADDLVEQNRREQKRKS